MNSSTYEFNTISRRSTHRSSFWQKLIFFGANLALNKMIWKDQILRKSENFSDLPGEKDQTIFENQKISVKLGVWIACERPMEVMTSYKNVKHNHLRSSTQFHHSTWLSACTHGWSPRLCMWFADWHAWKLLWIHVFCRISGKASTPFYTFCSGADLWHTV